MTRYDLHKVNVNLSNVSAYQAMLAMHEALGSDVLKDALESFDAREEAEKNTPTLPELRYSSETGIYQVNP